MKYLIWDYNGTILDDISITVRIENEMCKQRNLKYGYTIADYQNMFSIPMYDYYLKLGCTFENETFADAANQFNDMYEMLFDECTIHEGVIDLLESGTRKGYRHIILSSCYEVTLRDQCRALQIDSYFDCIMGTGDKLGGSKSEIGKAWMLQQQVSPDDCIYLGDTLADYETAKELGISQCYLIARGHQSYERLKQVNPNTFHHLKEIEL